MKKLYIQFLKHIVRKINLDTQFLNGLLYNYIKITTGLPIIKVKYVL